MTRLEDQTTACRSAGVEILGMPEELDLLTADRLVEQGCAALARQPQLLLLDLARLSFCDARGLASLVRIANRADAAGCRYGLIAPRPPVAKMLRIGDLNRRLPVFATIEDALASLAGISGPERGRTDKPDDDCLPVLSVSIPRPIRFLTADRDPGKFALLHPRREMYASSP